MEKTPLSICLFAAMLSLAGCSANQENSSNANNASNNDGDASSTTSEHTEVSNALVIYFSATNHTKSVAETISSHIASPIYELVPVNPYTSADLNYSNADSRVVKEHEMVQSEDRVNVELENTHFEEFDDSDYIFLGAPVWWQQLSWVIENFLVDNDFSNKTIIPFGTSASSGFNSDNLTSLTEGDSDLTWLSPQRFSSSVNSNTVIDWLDSLDFDFR